MKDNERIARMISTVDANNGFRRELLPLAMSGSSFAANGLYNAILALSAFHRHGSGAALPYKTYALRLLSHSLEKETASAGETESQLAASMMLCVYNVSPFCCTTCPLQKMLTRSRSLMSLRGIGISTSMVPGLCCINMLARQVETWTTTFSTLGSSTTRYWVPSASHTNTNTTDSRHSI